MARSKDSLGRVLGIVVFLIGILVLLFTAYAAHTFFMGAPLATPAATGANAVPVTTRLTDSAVKMLFHIAVLIVMAVVGSMIAGRGLQLFYTSSDQANNPKDC